MLPTAWQVDFNITNICTGKFCQHGKQTPDKALVETCVRGTSIDILSGPVRLFCYHRASPTHEKTLCLHDNVILLSANAVQQIVVAVAARREIGKREAQSWATKTLYRFPDVVVHLACADLGPIRHAIQKLVTTQARPHFLEGRLDLWWALFTHGIVSCGLFDTEWLQVHLSHMACVARPTSEMLDAAHHFEMWGQYLKNVKAIPGWAIHSAFQQAILFEIGLLGIPGMTKKGRQKDRPILPREILHKVSAMVFSA